MSFFCISEQEALDIEISTFRKRMTDALKLGHFQAGGNLDLSDKDLKINQEYEEFRRHWTKEKP